MSRLIESYQRLLARNRFGDFDPGVADGVWGKQSGAAVRRAKWALGYPQRDVNSHMAATLAAFLKGPKRGGRRLPVAFLARRKKRQFLKPYTNPFAGARVWPGRTDMGVDYHGIGPIRAIGDAVIIGNGGQGWPGGNYLLYRLLNGPHKGRYIYVAEAIVPTVSAGRRVRKGQQIARFGYGAAPFRFPGIETGWSTATLNLAEAHSHYREGDATREGADFRAFLKSTGAPT